MVSVEEKDSHTIVIFADTDLFVLIKVIILLITLLCQYRLSFDTITLEQNY